MFLSGACVYEKIFSIWFAPYSVAAPALRLCRAERFTEPIYAGDAGRRINTRAARRYGQSAGNRGADPHTGADADSHTQPNADTGAHPDQPRADGSALVLLFSAQFFLASG